MSHLRLWRYRVSAGQENAFEKAYGSEGDWAQLFQLADGYLGTELRRTSQDNTHWSTIDRWRTETDWNVFLENHGVAYHELNLRLTSLTEENIYIGNQENQTIQPF